VQFQSRLPDDFDLRGKTMMPAIPSAAFRAASVGEAGFAGRATGAACGDRRWEFRRPVLLVTAWGHPVDEEGYYCPKWRTCRG
jgi:hypothetical protein